MINQNTPAGCSGGNCQGAAPLRQESGYRFYRGSGGSPLENLPRGETTGVPFQSPGAITTPQGAFAEEPLGRPRPPFVQPLPAAPLPPQQPPRTEWSAGGAAVPPPRNPQAIPKAVVYPRDILNQKGIKTPEFFPWILPESPQENPIAFDAESLQFMGGFLRTQVGRYVTVEFLIGNNNLVVKRGILIDVGINYMILLDEGTQNIVVCDFYAIKFVTIETP